ncbi:MAG: hypothetical protein A2W23_05450 [Planctomycetes bacterium RBG_16_43_13]|nr:MAG: hypothetical protein A2W23_05450 [Planctomycetes bacterium RBG_16_43_13]
MDVSIIIVTLNGGRMLLDCVDSVFASTKGATLEVIVVDNGSTDNSIDELAKRYPEIKLIRNGGNLGFATAVNMGIDVSAGRYICLLNNDTKVKDGAFERLVKFLDSKPDCGIAAPQLLNDDNSKQNSYDNIPTIATALLNKSLLRFLFPHKYPSKRQETETPIEVETVIGACMMVKREVINKIGKLDEDYFIFLEETDWCLRARRAGWKIFFVPQAEVYHLQGQTKRRHLARAKVEYTYSLLTFFYKNSSFLHCIVVGMFLFLRALVSSVFLLLMNILTFFSISKVRSKLIIYSYLFLWLLLLCPKGMGLRGKQ